MRYGGPTGRTKVPLRGRPAPEREGRPIEPRILLVEDHTTLRASLTATLRGEGYEVMALRDGRDVPSALDTFRPDLVVLDVWLPDGPDGFGLARLVRSRGDVPIVFLTAATGLDERLTGFEAGGDEPFPVPELLARIQALLRRTGRARSAVHRVGDLLVDEGDRTAVRGQETIALTPTEFDLLVTLVRQPGKVLSKPRLLALVWDRDDHHVNVVEAHVSALRRKLEEHGPRLIHTVRGRGYVVRA